MKKFRFKYSPIAWILLFAVLIISLGGLIWNVFSLIEYLWAGAIKIIGNAFIILFNLALVVLDVGVIAFGFYVVKDKKLICYFGLIKTEYDLEDVVAVTHFKKSDKLVVYFNDKKYTVIVISPDSYDDFIGAIRTENPQIIYDTKIDGEDTPE